MGQMDQTRMRRMQCRSPQQLRRKGGGPKCFSGQTAIPEKIYKGLICLYPLETENQRFSDAFRGYREPRPL